MKYLRYSVLALFLYGGLPELIQAQAPNSDGGRHERVERIHQAKVAFIGEKLNLNQEQAQQFWPLYHEYEKKRHDLRHKARPFRNKNLEELSDQQLLEGLQAKQNAQQMELNLEKEYTDRFLKILTVRQVVNFHRAEREFTKALLHKIEGKHGGKPSL